MFDKLLASWILGKFVSELVNYLVTSRFYEHYITIKLTKLKLNSVAVVRKRTMDKE
jgi:hypothetical protein